MVAIMPDKDLKKLQLEKNPAHFCDCGKYLGHRGFCSTKCHNSHYDDKDSRGE